MVDAPFVVKVVSSRDGTVMRSISCTCASEARALNIRLTNERVDIEIEERSTQAE